MPLQPPKHPIKTPTTSFSIPRTSGSPGAPADSKCPTRNRRRGPERSSPHPPVVELSYIDRISRVIDLLQGKWTVRILWAMRDHPVRLSELKREIPAASKKALTASLRSLEAHRVILRQDLSSSVLRVEYTLTDAIKPCVGSLLDSLAEWTNICPPADEPVPPLPLEASD
jgi:DNA-binding HxlR family transcriptional regulator